MTALDDALRSAARTPCLLVASDYDGVVAPIVADPDAAMPDTAAIEALAQLAATPDTHVAMISGRTLRDLRRVTGEPGEVMLLGSHGAETASGDLLSPSQLSIRDAIISEMDQISADYPGSRVEAKPGGVAFHYRSVAEPLQGDATRRILAGPAARPNLKVMEGKKIVEVSLVAGNKGTALTRLRKLVEADRVVFLGDDVTDEDAFAVLRPDDVGIKVGPEPTMAQYRIPGQEDVSAVLTGLAVRRAGT